MPEALLKLLIVLAFSLITLSLHNAGRVVIENLPMSRRERLLIAIPAVLGFFFILFLNLFRKLHNNSARFLHDQGSTRRGARLFSRSTRNNCRPDYIGIQKISQGLRGISRHKEIRFILFLRGLISNLSLATKFYSSPRRPPSIVF